MREKKRNQSAGERSTRELSQSTRPEREEQRWKLIGNVQEEDRMKDVQEEGGENNPERGKRIREASQIGRGRGENRKVS